MIAKHTKRGVKFPRGEQAKPASGWSRIVMIFGELSMTAGVLVGIFYTWVLYIDSPLTAWEQGNSANLTASQFMRHRSDATETMPVTDRVKDYEDIAVLFVPRFGNKYKRVIRETTDVTRVLNSKTAGVGHYPHTALPGTSGNFAVAAHEVGWGAAFGKLSELRLGDKIYVLTPKGWYIYAYRSSEYVKPDGVNVLRPLPQSFAVPDETYIMTMTTCNPPFSVAERLIAYAVLEKWQADVPHEIVNIVNS
ncbi:class E sortase [Tropheryma whipplei]|nr:class E sortase [Tropheryma whipplei]MCO8182591.1 class E sortase [Tropheryma whipplei]MCO8189941.1 class E sortase [Tropheryma whipplei]CAD66874.1 putative membrane protein [Tropheryma whipplei TW08/27]